MELNIILTEFISIALFRLSVNYICDGDLAFYPEQPHWYCNPGGNWSYSFQPRCFNGIYIVLPKIESCS